VLSNKQKIYNVISAHLRTCEFSRADLLDLIDTHYPATNHGSVLPSDYLCKDALKRDPSNAGNRGNYWIFPRFLERLSKGTYKFVGWDGIDKGSIEAPILRAAISEPKGSAQAVHAHPRTGTAAFVSQKRSGDTDGSSVGMQIDLDKLRSRLFEKDTVRKRVLRDFGIKQNPADAKHFARLVVDALEQSVVAQPLKQTITNKQVFRAAVRALGSNNRDWCDFLRNEEQIKNLLAGYDPHATVQSFEKDSEILHKLKFCLKGQTSSRDAESILRWAHILSERESFYQEIVKVGERFRDDFKIFQPGMVDDFELTLCIVGHFADENCSGRLKFPGMRYALASEFLKNLGWSCFKPDRHIQRLFDRWFAHQNTALIDEKKLAHLESLILGGKRSAELRTFLKYSMIGKSVSPARSIFSQVDNIVWLLGKYVEKKGKETSTVYVNAI
jgi:hypothetical protein